MHKNPIVLSEGFFQRDLLNSNPSLRRKTRIFTWNFYPRPLPPLQMHNSGRNLVCLFVSEFSSWSPLRQWPIFCSNAPSKGNEVECHRVPLTIFRSPDRFQRKSMLSSWPSRDNAVLLLSTVALAGGFNRIFWAPGTCLGWGCYRW